MKAFDVIRTLQSNERFDAFEGECEGRKVFIKKAKNDKTRQLLTGVPKNSMIVNELGAKTAFKFRAPKVIEQEGDWLVTEWLDGQSLETDVYANPTAVTQCLSDFFIVFDGESVADQGFRHIFTKKGLDERIKERALDKVDGRQLELIEQAQALFDRLQPQLKPALQDADIKPDHIYRDQQRKGAFILIDSEHLSNQWPRFYDLGNVYVKYLMRGNKQFSNQLVRDFLHRSGVTAEEAFEPLRAVAIVRGISLHWELDYDEGAEKYNIPRAQEMLKRLVAAHNLEDLLY